MKSLSIAITHAVFMLVVIAGSFSPCFSERIYVFLPATIRPLAMQQKLAAVCPGVELTVFGRYEDFKAKVDADPPDAILTKPLLVSQFTGYSILLRAQKDGHTDEEFQLLSVDEKVSPGAIGSESVVGVLDFLGREGMVSFVARFLPGRPKIKRVTKVEDLLPLLTFKMVKTVLVSREFIPFIKKTSQLKLIETSLPSSQVGIAVIAVHSGSSPASMLNAFKNASFSSGIIPGVDSWK